MTSLLCPRRKFSAAVVKIFLSKFWCLLSTAKNVLRQWNGFQEKNRFDFWSPQLFPFFWGGRYISTGVIIICNLCGGHGYCNSGKFGGANNLRQTTFASRFFRFLHLLEAINVLFKQSLTEGSLFHFHQNLWGKPVGSYRYSATTKTVPSPSKVPCPLSSLFRPSALSVILSWLFFKSK